MILIGVPKEIKNHEYRVGLIPSSIKDLIIAGHDVIVETKAGEGSGFSDEEYLNIGAKISKSAEEVFKKSDMIVKVKEPQEGELKMLKRSQILYTYLHLAPDPDQTKGLIESGCSAIAYETITDDNNRLPLLAPMSEVAGKLSVQFGAHFLQKRLGGIGILLGGTPGTKKANVVIIGAGYAGANAAEVAIGMGANVFILDSNNDRLKEIHNMFNGRINTVYSTHQAISDLIKDADLLVSSVLVPGAYTPRLLNREMLRTMKKGAVFIDISIDQGGSSETSRVTTHDDPVFVEEGVVHYCVANMPGAVPRTSSIALNNATLKYALILANLKKFSDIKNHKHLLNGLNVYNGKITNKKVADALNYEFFDPLTIL